MSEQMAKEALQQRVASLVGTRVRAVHYVELAYESSSEHWDESPELDSLDHGLELELDDGRVVSIAWDWQFEHHDLNVFEGRLQPDVVSPDAACCDVTSRSRWSEFLGVAIQDARIDWDSLDGESRYPQDLVLTFEDGRRVWIMAAEKVGDTWQLFAMDHVTVVFDPVVAQRLGRSQTGSASR